MNEDNDLRYDEDFELDDIWARCVATVAGLALVVGTLKGIFSGDWGILLGTFAVLVVVFLAAVVLSVIRRVEDEL